MRLCTNAQILAAASYIQSGAIKVTSSEDDIKKTDELVPLPVRDALPDPRGDPERREGDGEVGGSR